MPRIIAGTARGIRLTSPEGMDTRPTADARKEAVFSSIQFDLPSARFLDLFSGSGAAGLEALSRGAASAVLVEQAPPAIRAIEDNVARTHLSGARLMKMDVYRALDTLKAEAQQFDVIFMDPPYHQGHEDRVLERIASLGLLAPDGLIVVESAADTSVAIPEGYSLIKNKTYRVTQFLLLRRAQES